MEDTYTSIYPVCRALMGSSRFEAAASVHASLADPEPFADMLEDIEGVPGWLPDLARIEYALGEASGAPEDGQANRDEITVNPALLLLVLGWKGIVPCYEALKSGDDPVEPTRGEETVVVWREPGGGPVRMRAASGTDLLALKVTVERLDPEHAAGAGGVPVGAIDTVIDAAVRDGLLLRPASRIRRYPDEYPVADKPDEPGLAAESFTLQWHITQSCDLHCRHCYDRTDRTPMSLERGIAVLDDMRRFCRERYVDGHVTFSGGNPLMHPRFMELYREASARGLGLGILGNPSPRSKLAGIMDIAAPAYYQVSLEGLEEHNDLIRGKGHFRRTLEFLDMMNEMGVYSMVMLTLTRDNIDQVIPLARLLEGRTESFNFNRLSPVGEGASLALPEPSRYADFLGEYLDAREECPHMRIKDNLFNLTLTGRGLAPFDGCTGHGCGAAFNFISVLADGEAHACRKFPSPIGNVYEQTISEIYDSEAAKRYRRGASGCDGCGLRTTCGGCMSIAYGMGLDPFEQTDPFCLIAERDKS